jgi:hypothetical protein
MASKRGINPVTIRPMLKDTLCVTISRLWVVKPDGTQVKNLTIMLWDESKPLEAQTIAQTILDEDKFIDALGFLFPRGELQTAHLQPAPTTH